MVWYKDIRKYGILVVVAMLVVAIAGFSYGGERVVPKNEIYGAYRNALGEIGFFNYEGAMIKSPQFDLMWKWDDEVIILRDHGDYGALNYLGTPVVSFKYEFLDEPSNGTIIYGTDVTYKGPKYYGLLDTHGNVIVEAQFESVEKLPNGGIITAITYPEGKKYGVVFKDKKNFKPAYDEIFAYNDQFVIVKNMVKGEAKYGFISASNRYSHVVYDAIQITEDGEYVIVCSNDKGRKTYELLNSNNVEVIRERFAYISPKGFLDNAGNVKYFTTVALLEDYETHKTFDLLSLEGVLQGYRLLKVDDTPILGNYYKVMGENGLLGLVDTYGNMVIEPKFISIEGSNGGYFVGVNENGRGVFNRLGESIIEYSNYDRIQITKDAYIIAQAGKHFNIFDGDGMLRFQFVGDEVTGIGDSRFITKKQSPHKDTNGKVKYYYNLVNEEGRQRVKLDQYAYMEVIAENRIAIGEDTDGKAIYPSGIEFIRAPFADRYGVVDFDGNEIIPVAFSNMSRYDKGMLFAQVSNGDMMDAYNLMGEKINNMAWSMGNH
jgi:hypothetical protein